MPVYPELIAQDIRGQVKRHQ